MKAVKLKRFAGPYESIPFDYYIQSPVGLVPKGIEGDTRLIFHLSYPRGTKKSKLINANTPKDKCTVKYKDLLFAIRLCQQVGKGCFIAKADMKSTFHNLPICCEA